MTEAHIEDVEMFAERVVHFARNEHLRLNAAIERALSEQKQEMNSLCINCGAKRSMHLGADQACVREGHRGQHFKESAEIIGITVSGGPKGFPRSITYNGIRYVVDEVQS